MYDKIGQLKSYRSFRIRVEENDKFDFSFYSKSLASSNLEEMSGIELDNLSVSGMGIFSGTKLPKDHEFFVKLIYDHRVFEAPIRIARIKKIYNEYGECEKYLYGLRFENLYQTSCKKFLGRFISTFSKKRLRKQLTELLLNEKELNYQSFDDNFNLFLSLLQDMRRFSTYEFFLDCIIKETARSLNSKSFNFYMYKSGQSFVKPYFLKGTTTESLISVKGTYLEKKPFESGNLLSVFIKDHSKDDILLKQCFDEIGYESIHLLAIPISSFSGEITGFIFFAREKELLHFSKEEERLANLLSSLISTTLNEDNSVVEADILETVDAESFKFRKKRFDPHELELMGESQNIKSMEQFIKKCSENDECIIIKGDSGVGKSHLAKMIHHKSMRKSMSCGHIICDNLSEFIDIKDLLLGSADSVGRFELYSGGTLAFHDIDRLSMLDQKKLVELLLSRSDIRFVALTTQDLEKSIIEGRFYRKLFDIFNHHQFFIKPLLERKKDIIPLANYFIEKHCILYGHIVKSIGTSVEEIFLEHHWPRNIAELELAIERLIFYHPSSHTLNDINNDVIPIFEYNHSLIQTYQKTVDENCEILGSIDGEESEKLITGLIIEKYMEQNPEETLDQVARFYHLPLVDIVVILDHLKSFFESDQTVEICEDKKIAI